MSSSFVFSQNFYLETFHWTRRMPSWFFHIFFCSFCGHVDYWFDSPCGYFCHESRTLSLSLGKTIRSWFFLKRNHFIPRASLITWTAVLATLSNSFRQKPERFSFRAQKIQIIFTSSRELSPRVFRWTPKKPSWQTWTFENQFFLRKNIRRYKIATPSQETFFKKTYWAHKNQFWHLCWKVRPKSGIFSFKVSKQSRNNVFFRRKTFWFKVFFWTHGMQFWHFCRFCFIRNQKHSRSEPKSLKSFVSSRKVCFGKFRWTPRMPSWRKWSFTANRDFLGRTMEIYKILSSSKEFFSQKVLLVT